MIDYDKIFHADGKSVDIFNFLEALTSRENSIEDKRKLWNKWVSEDLYLKNMMNIIVFFKDSLFENDTHNYLLSEKNANDFYEISMNLDMAGFEPIAYYMLWILGCGLKNNRKYYDFVKCALEYDSDVILSIFPDIKEVVFND